MKSARLAELDAALNMEESTPADRNAVKTGRNTDGRDDGYRDSGGRHSVLADLKQKSGQLPPPRREPGMRSEEVL